MSCDCEPVRFYSEKIRLSRKVHKCCECSLPIIPGEKYQYISMMADYISTYKTCLECASVRDWISTESDCGAQLGGLVNEAIDSHVIDRVDERVYLDGHYSHTNKGKWFITPEYADKIKLVNGKLKMKLIN